MHAFQQFCMQQRFPALQPFSLPGIIGTLVSACSSYTATPHGPHVLARLLAHVPHVLQPSSLMSRNRQTCSDCI